MSERFASVVVRARWAIVALWIAIAVVVTLTLPSIEEAQTGRLGDLVPAGSAAVGAEERAAELFAFPVTSRTVVVERAPDGLGIDGVARTAVSVFRLNQAEVTVGEAAGAFGLTNALPGLPFAREMGTTTLTYLLFRPDVGQTARTRTGEDFAQLLSPAPPGTTVGVTGTIPARTAQGDVIGEGLPLFELATVILVALIVAVHLRSIVAPLVTLLTVGVAVVISTRVVAQAGQALGVSVPSEVQPVLLALLFGVVTDYGLFYMSRFRRRLLEGSAAREAARRTTAELTPIIFACGIAVAAGMGALGVAELGFLQAFGPGVALAVLVGLLVALTLLPALMALLGAKLFWPSDPAAAAAAHDATPARTERLIALAVRAPKRTIAATLAVLAVAGLGLFWAEIGNPLIRGLPPENEVRVAYDELTRGFAPGAAAPVSLVVEAPGIVRERQALADLQTVLANQPGIAGVIGPASSPAEQPLGAVLSRTGDAARFVLITQDDPLGSDAVRLLTNLRSRLDGLLRAVDLPQAEAALAGDTVLVAEVIELANSDLSRVVPAVLLAVAIVLALFLRSLVAPLYLVLLAALAPLAALGLSVAFFQGVLDQGELAFFVPIAGGVLLVALGSDYNIFLVGRIWGEARTRSLREAIVVGATGASRAISAAGMVLAASFAALALVPVRSFQQLGFVLAVGLLIDAFVVRTVLAPAVIALVGRRSGWPGHALDRKAEATQA